MPREAVVWRHGPMEFLAGHEIGKSVTGVLQAAKSVRVASAFFSPGSSTLSELQATKSRTLIISEEFTTNNPKNLEQLTSAVVRSVPTDSEDGKLHAKVFIAEMPDGATAAPNGWSIALLHSCTHKKYRRRLRGKRRFLAALFDGG
jgi:hypothetical protein